MLLNTLKNKIVLPKTDYFSLVSWLDLFIFFIFIRVFWAVRITHGWRSAGQSTTRAENPVQGYLRRHLLHVGPVSGLVHLLRRVVVPHTDLHLFLAVPVGRSRHGHVLSSPVVLHRFGSCSTERGGAKRYFNVLDFKTFYRWSFISVVSVLF